MNTATRDKDTAITVNTMEMLEFVMFYLCSIDYNNY
jgi:hypothetical protein